MGARYPQDGVGDFFTEIDLICLYFKLTPHLHVYNIYFSVNLHLKYCDILNLKIREMENKNELEMFSFDEIKNEFIGEIGTPKRTLYEQELMGL